MDISKDQGFSEQEVTPAYRFSELGTFSAWGWALQEYETRPGPDPGRELDKTLHKVDMWRETFQKVD